MKCTDCQKPVRPVVALDIDGTLGDYHGHFFQFAECWLGYCPGPVEDGVQASYDGSTDLATWMGVTKEVYRQIKLAYRQGGMKRWMPVYGGASLLVKNLMADGVEVWITTTRPYMRLDNVDPDTREWLRRNNIPYDGLIYDVDKYDRLVDCVGLERIAGVLEDLAPNFDHAWERGMRPVLRATTHNRAIHRTPSASTLPDAGVLLTNQVMEWRETYG